MATAEEWNERAARIFANKRENNAGGFNSNIAAAIKDGKTLRHWTEQDDAYEQKLQEGLIIELGGEQTELERESSDSTKH